MLDDTKRCATDLPVHNGDTTLVHDPITSSQCTRYQASLIFHPSVSNRSYLHVRVISLYYAPALNSLRGPKLQPKRTTLLGM